MNQRQFAVDCDCAGLSTARGFVPGRLAPPAIVEAYPNTPDGVRRASESERRHYAEERRAGRFFYWCIHVGGRHLLSPTT